MRRKALRAATHGGAVANGTTKAAEASARSASSGDGCIVLEFDNPVHDAEPPAKPPSVAAESFECATPVHVERPINEPANGADYERPEAVQLEPAPVRTLGPGARTLPHSLEVEQYLLSCCLLDGADMLSRCHERGVSAGSFYFPTHRILYAKLEDIARRRLPVDVSVLAEEMSSTQLAEVGGVAYLLQVSALIPTTAQANYFVEKVRELSILRELIKTADSVAEDCYRHSGGLDELLASVRTKFDQATDPVSHNGWSVVSADKLHLSPLEPPPEIIKGLLYQGGTMMLSGPSKAHKTYTMLAAGAAIAGGHEWLGFRTIQSPVLYLNLELQDFAAKTRLAAIYEAIGIAPPADLHILNLRGVMVSLDRLSLRLGSAIQRTAAKLVAVDPHYKISSASGVEENSNDAQAKFLYAIETLCAQHGAAVLLAHHFAKGNASMKNAIDRAAGGGALARWPDVVMTLTEHEEPDCMTAEFALRNFAPVAPFVVRWKHPLWSRDGSLEPTKLKQLGGRKDEHPAEEALEKLGNEILTNAEWRKRTGYADGTFRRKRDALVASGKVKFEMGTYRAADNADGTSEPSKTTAGLNPADYLPTFAAHFQGHEKRTDARPLKRAADGVKGALGTKEWRQLLDACLAQGILNKGTDGRYYVP